jgi:POT family proton-dependent oligopeptide transporter
MNQQAGTHPPETTAAGGNFLFKVLGYFARHPRGFWFIFWGEFAERASYYGMRAILVLYMTVALRFTDAQSTVIMHFFIAACYFLTVPGGYLADNFLGKYWTIVSFCIPYIAGHFILGIETVPALVIALALLALGSGVTKPNISTLMGMTYDQYRPGQDKLRSDAFAMYYWSINLGSFMSSFLMPEIRDDWGYRIAFLFPAALMVIAFPLFALGKKYYAVEVISRKKKTPEERRQQWVIVGRLSGVFVVGAFFWCIFDQASSTWILFARDHLNRTLFGFKFAADQFGSLNSLFILILLPLLTMLLRYLDNRGLHLRPTDKMTVGFVLATCTMAVMATAGFLALGAENQRVSALWIVFAFIVLTLAEILVSVIGLELAFVAAPKGMKSFVTGLWWLTVAAGNLSDVVLTPFYGDMTPGGYFGMLTALLAVVTVAFVFLARQFNRAAARWKAEDALTPEPSQPWPEGVAKKDETGAAP